MVTDLSLSARKFFETLHMYLDRDDQFCFVQWYELGLGCTTRSFALIILRQSGDFLSQCKVISLSSLT